MVRAWSRILIILIVGYPLAVYIGLQNWPPRNVAVILIVVLSIRLSFLHRRSLDFYQVLMGVLLAISAIGWNLAIPLKLYPVLINSMLLGIFAYSLYMPPTIIERLARIKYPILSPKGIAYARRVTQVWCLFFLLNSIVALYTALYASMHLWVLYNGFIGYLLMGGLFMGEWLVRKRVLAKDL